jgi:hypothetical protein
VVVAGDYNSNGKLIQRKIKRQKEKRSVEGQAGCRAGR